MVPRSIQIEGEHQIVHGETRITTFERGTVRLVAHEVDHLYGVLYRTRVRPERRRTTSTLVLLVSLGGLIDYARVQERNRIPVRGVGDRRWPANTDLRSG